MHYHIILTELCDSKCSYCYKKSMEKCDNESNILNKKFKFDFSAPASSEVNIPELKKFLKKDPNAVLVFYGGEPLMEIEKIKQIIDNIDVPFRMQTNAKEIYKLPRKYLNKIGKILISLDGTRERTDYNRGVGTYDKVMENIEYIKRVNRYKGELIARMTLSEFPDIYEQVLSLIKSGFSSIHWQLDVGFYCDFEKEKFEKFVNEYNKSISRLIDFWIRELKKGNIIRIYPFLAIIDSLLKKEKSRLRCGAGYEGYAIATDGKVIACPITNCINDFVAGDLRTNPENLKIFNIGGDCLDCEIKDLCGGRCLYWNKSNLWPKQGDELICKTIKHLISELKNHLPEIKNLINHKIISKRDFLHEKYFGPEIIP